MAAKKKALRKKSARKKARKAPAKKATPRKKAARKKVVRIKAPPARPVPRELPNDEAWRALIETAIEKPDPIGGAAARKK